MLSYMELLKMTGVSTLSEVNFSEDLVRNAALVSFLTIHWMYFAMSFPETIHRIQILQEIPASSRVIVLLKNLYDANISMESFLSALKKTIEFSKVTKD